jgi:dephospho-CoA kinase
MRRVRIYGITGGIASGKSTAAKCFRELGIPVVDADEIARDLRAPDGKANPAILARFGTVDPGELRTRIARDPAEKKALEAILHPMIAQESLRRFSEIERAATSLPSPPPYLLYEAALLVEAGRASDCDGVILVESTEDNRLDRLVKRDQMSPESARRFIDIQPSLEAKRAAATHVIHNDGSLDELRNSVLTLHRKLIASAD